MKPERGSNGVATRRHRHRLPAQCDRSPFRGVRRKLIFQMVSMSERVRVLPAVGKCNGRTGGVPSSAPRMHVRICRAAARGQRVRRASLGSDFCCSAPATVLNDSPFRVPTATAASGLNEPQVRARHGRGKWRKARFVIAAVRFQAAETVFCCHVAVCLPPFRLLGAATVTLPR